MADGQITWTLTVPAERELALRAVLMWDALAKNSPGRFAAVRRNGECRLFLIDRSKAGTARWCSMAVCGNRMKARRHYQRAPGRANRRYPGCLARLRRAGSARRRRGGRCGPAHLSPRPGRVLRDN